MVILVELCYICDPVGVANHFHHVVCLVYRLVSGLPVHPRHTRHVADKRFPNLLYNCLHLGADTKKYLYL